MNEYLRSVQSKKPTKLLMSEIVKINNSLAKSTPSVEIGEVSYHKGLTDRDLIHEFTRLKAIAQHAIDGKGVSSVGEAGQGTLPGLGTETDRLPKE